MLVEHDAFANTHRSNDLCDVQCFRAIYTVSIITWCLDRYGHFNDAILNWHQVYLIGGATCTINYCPRANAFLCKNAAFKTY